MDEGAIIRKLRKGAKLKQAELAARLGENQVWVSRHETGEVRVTLSDLERIAKACGARFEPVIVYADADAAEEIAAVASRVARAFGAMGEEARAMLYGMLDRAEQRIPKQARAAR